MTAKEIVLELKKIDQYLEYGLVDQAHQLLVTLIKQLLK